MTVKRNQVEQAICLMHEPGASAPSVELKTRLKRLLETDRDLGRKPRSADREQANYAFFSAEPPGSGVEVWFSEYEAFALYTGWRLLEHGFPQATAVSILRRARPRLEPKHQDILRLDPALIFDQKRIRQAAKSGSIAASTLEPLFLTIASRQGRQAVAGADATREVKICDEMDLMRLLRSEVGLSTTNFELTGPAHRLRAELQETTPTKRGRAAS
ncbi:MAG: hypothetical protein ACRD3W_28810 [Terriglobales bacterium]